MIQLLDYVKSVERGKDEQKKIKLFSFFIELILVRDKKQTSASRTRIPSESFVPECELEIINIIIKNN